MSWFKYILIVVDSSFRRLLAFWNTVLHSNTIRNNRTGSLDWIVKIQNWLASGLGLNLLSVLLEKELKWCKEGQWKSSKRLISNSLKKTQNFIEVKIKYFCRFPKDGIIRWVEGQLLFFLATWYKKVQLNSVLNSKHHHFQLSEGVMDFPVEGCQKFYSPRAP